MSQITTEKVNVACAVGSALVGAAIYFVLVAPPAVIIMLLLPEVPTWLHKHIHMPWYIWAPMWASGIWATARKLYPSCRRLRS